MILVGKNNNFISNTLCHGLKDCHAWPVGELATVEDKAGVDYIGVTVRYTHDTQNDLVARAVDTVQRITRKPLYINSLDPLAVKTALKVCHSKALINSTSLEPGKLIRELEMAQKYHADIVRLPRKRDSVSQSVNERCMTALDLVFYAGEQGIPNEKIWIDIGTTPVLQNAKQVRACFEFLKLLHYIAPGCKSIIDPSHVSIGAPDHLRSYLDRAFLIMLMKFGLYAIFVNAFDVELINIARERESSLVKLVHDIMEGESPCSSRLNSEEVKFAKAVRVLNGEPIDSPL